MLPSEKPPLLSIANVTWRTIGGFMISTFFLWLTFRHIDFSAFKIIPSSQSLVSFFAAVAVFLFTVWVQAQRTKLLWVENFTQWKNTHTLQSLLVGNFYNCIIPGNLGEGMKAWHFGRKNNYSFSRSFSAVLAEKWVDAHMFLVFVVILFCLHPFQHHFIYYSILLVAAVVVGLSIIYHSMLKLVIVKKKIWGIVFLYKKAGIPLFKTYLHVVDFLKFLKHKKKLPLYVGIGFFVFALNVLQYYLLLQAVGLNQPLSSFFTAYLISMSMMLIIAVPSAPGNLGVLHYGVYSSLILAAGNKGIIPDPNLLQIFALYTVYLHLSCFLPEVLLGIVVVVQERKLIF